MGLTGPSQKVSTRLVATLTALAFLLTACSPSGRTSSTSTTQPNLPKGYEVKTDSTVTVAVRSLPSNFNPGTSAGDNPVTQMVMAQVWPSPFVTTPSFEMASTDLLLSAEVHGVSPLKVVYDLNPKATWSNGTPITAADFSYDWREHLATSALLPDAGLVAGYRDIASVVGSDGGKTVTVTFNQPFAQWQELFSYLPPAEVATRYGWTKAFEDFSSSKVLSGGPFEISSFRPGHELTLSRNPTYWGPAPTIAHIRFVVERSGAATLAGLERGTISLAELAADAPSPGVLGAGAVGLKGAARARAMAGGRNPLAWTGGLSSSLWQLCFNFDDPLTANILVRRGIEHALDRSVIVADSEDLVDPRVHVAVSRLMVAGETNGTGSRPVAKAPDLYHPAAAVTDFKEAGYELGAGGLMRAGGSGPPLVIDLLEPSGNWAVSQAGLVIQSELAAIGIRVDIEKSSLVSILARRLPRGNFEMALAPFAVGATTADLLPEYSDPVLPYRYLAGPSPTPTEGRLPTGGSPSGALWQTSGGAGREPGAVAIGAVTRDVLGFDSQTVDSYFSKALQALDPPAELNYLEKAEQELWRQVVTIPLFQTGMELVRSARLENVSVSPTPAGPLWNAQEWAILKHLPTRGRSA